MPEDFDFSQLPQNQTFKAMPLSDKYGYLAHVSPTFKTMRPEDQQGYVQHLTGGPEPTPSSTNFEQDRTPQEGFLGAAWNDVKGAAKGVASMAVRPYTEAYKGYQEGGIGEGAKRGGMALLEGPLGSPVDNVADVAEQNERQKKAGYSAPYRAATALTKGAGILNPQAMEESAATGDEAGVYGHTVLPLAAAASPLLAEGAGKVTDLLPSRDAIATSMRTPKGALTPRVRGAAEIGGGLLGATAGGIGLGGGGALGGFFMGSRVGSRLADLAIPLRLPPEIGTPENPGYMAKLPTRMPPKAAAPGGFTVDRPEPQPNRPITTQTPLAEFAARQAAAPPVATAASKLPGVNVIPEPRPEFPGETPKYMASIPRGRLPGLAAAGKPGAGEQLQQLGKTVLYTPPEGYPGPRVEQAPTSPTAQTKAPLGSLLVKPKNGNGLGIKVPSYADQFPSEKPVGVLRNLKSDSGSLNIGSQFPSEPPRPPIPLAEAVRAPKPQEQPLAVKPVRTPTVEKNVDTETVDRNRMANLASQVRNLNNDLRTAKSYQRVRTLTTSLREKGAELDALKDKYGTSKPTGGEEPKGTFSGESKVGTVAREKVGSPKASKTPTYDAMENDGKEWAASYAESLKHMPQALQDPEMKDLKRYGDLGTPLKERIALREKARKQSSFLPNIDLSGTMAA
jgi:hypothetical protein